MPRLTRNIRIYALAENVGIFPGKIEENHKVSCLKFPLRAPSAPPLLSTND